MMLISVIVLTSILYVSCQENRFAPNSTVRRTKTPFLQCHYEKPPRSLVHLFGGDDFGESAQVECDGGLCIKYAHTEGTARGCSLLGIGLNIGRYCNNMSKKNSCMDLEGGRFCCCNDRTLCNSAISLQSTTFAVSVGVLYLLLAR
uniref:Activin_recp domain-containing protein n=1 Tax=Steinernema glaseri TaxID=37863 RepID=A0A1I7Z4Y3_9BILA